VVGKHAPDKDAELLVGAAALGKLAETGFRGKLYQRLKERLHLGEPSVSHIPGSRVAGFVSGIRAGGQEGNVKSIDRGRNSSSDWLNSSTGRQVEMRA
jgi:hypothetical protein